MSSTYSMNLDFSVLWIFADLLLPAFETLRWRRHSRRPLQSSVENFFVDRQVISPRRTKSIEDARRRERFHAMRNIAREVKRIAG
jgi:hypothetical protein